MFLHKSIEKFKDDKKIKLLKNGIISFQQLINLIDVSDPYMLVGPAIVDKTKVSEFLTEWKEGKTNVESVNEKHSIISIEEIINNLSKLVKDFPEIKLLVNELYEKLIDATCKPCTKNRYILAMAKIIHENKDDGRIIDNDEIVKRIDERYFPVNNEQQINIIADFDLTWVKPDAIIGLGYDIIEGLSNCFDCAKKHLSRAKILWEEFNMNYPDHALLCFNEFTKANKVIEEAYTIYWDILGNLDQSSCELVGELKDLPKGYQANIIELANDIRTQRINFQNNISFIPEWNKMRLNIQKLENKIKKETKNNENS